MTLDRKDWPEDARNAQDAFDERVEDFLGAAGHACRAAADQYV